MPTRQLLIAATLLAFTLLPAIHANATKFTSIGSLGSHLPGYGSVAAVSSDGKTVVGIMGYGGPEAFVWTEETGLVGLGDLPRGNDYSAAFAVSADGSTIVGRSSTGFVTSRFGFLSAFLWNSEEGMIPLSTRFGASFFEDSAAYDISDDGSIVVGGYQRQATAWNLENGSQTGLGDLPGGRFSSSAIAISGDGSRIAGSSASGNGTEAFIWDEESGMIGLGDLPGGSFSSWARGISSDGSTVVGSSRSSLGTEAFVWNATDGMIGLGGLRPLTARSYATAASADGSIVVGSGVGYFGDEAFVWDKHNGMRSIPELLEAEGVDLMGLILLSATGISDDGRIIVGNAMTRSGQREGWILEIDLVPEPSTAALLMSASVILISRRRIRV